MKLYHISQNINTGWDTYSDAVVAAESAQDAASIHPHSSSKYFEGWPVKEEDEAWRVHQDWANDPSEVKVVEIGEANDSIERGVNCASFHAG